MQIRDLGFVLAVLTYLAPAPAMASACNHEIVVPIKFPPGKTEWVHRGVGTHFYGNFHKGQSLAIAAAGGTSHDTSGDLSWTVLSKDPWSLTIEGPGAFSKSSDFDVNGKPGGTLYVDKLPATGKYVISIGPCADWGMRGTIQIRASDPRLIVE